MQVSDYLKKQRIYITAVFMGFLFSFFILIGGSFQKAGTIQYLYSDAEQCLKSVFKFLLGGIVFTVFLTFLYNIRWAGKNRIMQWGKDKKIIQIMFEKHAWLVPFLCMFVFWIPYIVFLFPGTISWDGMEALTSAFRYMEWTNHHPFFSSALMRLAIEIGRMCGNENVGFFLYTFIQLLVQSGLFAVIFCFMKQMNTPYIFRLVVLIWFSFFSVWPTNGYAMNKDTMYYLAFLVFMLLTTKYMLGKGKPQKQQLFHVLYFLSMVFVCMFRNNGIYVIVLSIPFFAWTMEKGPRRKNMWKHLVVLLLFYMVYQRVLLPGLEILPGSAREMFSIPFQQTARYVKEHKNEITEAEAKAIAAILDYENLPELYDPELSDNVKWTYKDSAGITEKLDYAEVWFQQFLKHPLTYVDATLNNVYRYFDPTQEEFYGGTGGDFEISGPEFYYEHFSFSQNKKFQEERILLQSMAEKVKEIPVVGMLYGTGIYTWMLFIICGAFIVKKRYSMAAITVPLLITLLICIASPVNGCMRYMLPIMVTLPVLICWVFYRESKEEKMINGESIYE